MDGPEFINVDEAAALLRVDRKTLYKEIRNGKVPGVSRIGRLIRVHRPTLVQRLADASAHPEGNIQS